MGKPFSMDIRERICGDIAAGHSRRASAQVCGVPPSGGPVWMLIHGQPLVYRDDAFWRWRAVTQSAVWPDGIVVATPPFNQDLGLVQRGEDIAIE